jgi:dCTP diphosphatase
MTDKQTTIEDLKALIKQFTQERDWEKFLSPKTISTYLSIEAAELLEKFVWVDNAESKQKLTDKQKEIEHELADVAYWVLQMCWLYNIDLSKAIQNKIEHNAIKYPINTAKGLTKKYSEL